MYVSVRLPGSCGVRTSYSSSYRSEYVQGHTQSLSSSLSLLFAEMENRDRASSGCRKSREKLSKFNEEKSTGPTVCFFIYARICIAANVLPW